MKKKILIDASTPDEVRVAVIGGQLLDEFDAENIHRRPQKGHIFLAKIIRIEPSLQAAFVEYGGNRHGFLPFAEIHPDYYRIPVGDRPSAEETAVDEQPAAPAEIVIAADAPVEAITLDSPAIEEGTDTPGLPEETGAAEALPSSEDEAAPIKKKREPAPRYKIQEVIEPRQIVLVQVTKEERGSKGASLTTYLSMPGRYCVLMPNSGHRSGGVSRKIQDDDDRKRLKDIVKDCDLPGGMSLIVRTAGESVAQSEIRRDCDYLLHLWNEIRERTLQSIAPQMIYEESDLIQRAIRDMYSKDVEEIWVEGEEAFEKASAFMKLLVPTQVKRLKKHQDSKISLFTKFQVEEQVDNMMDGKVTLPSGGYLVVHITEALVSIDVNSGKATRERDIAETALKTNLEAATEIARQLRLRDLGGLIVVDFIDMDNGQHIQQVEKRFKEMMSKDRARIQIGRISSFGLLEMSRQRLRPSITEIHSSSCPHCNGSGVVRSKESIALRTIRALESQGLKGRAAHLRAFVPLEVALFMLNHRRHAIIQLEQRFDMAIDIEKEDDIESPYYRVETIATRRAVAASAERKPQPSNPIKRSEIDYPVAEGEDKVKDGEESTPSRNNDKRRRRRRGNTGRDRDNKQNATPTAAEKPAAKKGWLQRLLGSDD